MTGVRLISSDALTPVIDDRHGPEVVHVDEEEGGCDDDHDEPGLLQCTPTLGREGSRHAETPVHRHGHQNPDGEVEREVDEEGVQLAGKVGLQAEIDTQDVVHPQTEKTCSVEDESV